MSYRKHRRRISLSTLALLLLLVASGAPAEDELGFSGTWVMDYEESDDPREKMGASVRQTVEQTRERRGGEPEDYDDYYRGMLRGLENLVSFPERLALEADPAELLIDDGSGRLRIFYLDGEKHVRQIAGGTTLETIAIRQGSRIEIQQKTKQGTKILETYVLSGDGERLEVRVEVDAKRLKKPVTIRSLYKRAR